MSGLDERRDSRMDEAIQLAVKAALRAAAMQQAAKLPAMLNDNAEHEEAYMIDIPSRQPISKAPPQKPSATKGIHTPLLSPGAIFGITFQPSQHHLGLPCLRPEAPLIEGLGDDESNAEMRSAVCKPIPHRVIVKARSSSRYRQLFVQQAEASRKSSLSKALMEESKSVKPLEATEEEMRQREYIVGHLGLVVDSTPYIDNVPAMEIHNEEGSRNIGGKLFKELNA